MFNKQSPHPTEPTTNSKVDNIDLEMDDEKRNATHDEKALDVVDTGGMSREDYDFVQSFSPEAVAKIYRKIDWRLVPMLAILYLFSFIDRANIGNAKIEGMLVTLRMTDVQYNIVSSVFFIPYILFEVPSNSILQKYFRERPSWWIGGLCVTWGITMTLHGVVQSYGGLIAARIALGIAEAGFFPGAVLICSNWYPRTMLQTRIALFYTASALAGAVSGLLAFAIAKMNGLGGYEGWRWIFIIEGIATVCLGASVPFILIDSIRNSNRWLEPDEQRYLLLVTVSRDGGSGERHKAEGVNRSVTKQVFTDWILYAQGMIYWSNTVANNGLKFTMPTIIQQMGFTASNAQLMTIPAYCVGALSAYFSARFSDRFGRRMPFIVAAQTTVIIAYSILAPLAPRIKQNVGPCYFAICLACLGLYPINPGGNTWTANNLAGPAKRAMGMAFMISIGNAGGIVGSYIYLGSEAPSYPTGYGCSIGFAGAGIITALGLEFAFIRINKKRARMSVEEIRAKYTDQELQDMGDRSPLFKYTL